MTEPRPLFAHILAQTRQNVELLVAHKQISEVDGDEILSRLSARAERRSEQPSIVSLTQRTQRLNMSPAPPKVEARVIWGWSSEGQDPNDLTLVEEEIIEVISETNVDWWTGRNRSGKLGLFPSNHVEKLAPRGLSPILVPDPRDAVSRGPAEQRYSSPGVPRPPPHGLPQTHYPPGGYYMPDGPPPGGYLRPMGPPPGAVGYPHGPPAGPPMPQPATQQAPAKKNKFGGLGQVMAQSAASGAGFGAGAAIGSGIVNSIF